MPATPAGPTIMFKALLAAILAVIAPSIPKPQTQEFSAVLSQNLQELTVIEAQNSPILPEIEEATTTEPIVATTTQNCSCVAFVRQFFPYKQFPKVHRAIEIPITSDIPSIGSAVIFKYAPDGHVGLIIDMDKETILVKEYNFLRCQNTTRKIFKNDQFIVGYYR